MVHFSKEEIIKKLKEAGVVGAGGAGFPAYVKADSQAEWVVANAAECEPLLRVNQELLAHSAGEVLKGLRVMMRATGARKAGIGIKAKHKAVTAALQRAIAANQEYPPIGLHLLNDFYPAGDEHVMVHEVTGRTIPSGGIPIKVGVVVNNVETLFNVAKAMEDQPVTLKMVTVTGAVRRPATFWTAVGTRAQDLLPLAGGPSVQDYRIIDGGPMMGKLVGPEDVVTKTTGAFIVLPVNHSLVQNKLTSVDVDLRRARGMCCGCGYCTELCPRYLLGHDLRPDKTMYGIAHTRGELVQRGAAWMCSECGLCEVFSCPMGLSPRRVNAWMKREMAKQGFKPPASELKSTHTGRAYRLLPTTRLIARLGLSRYDSPAPLYAEPVRPRLVELRFKQHVGAAASPVVREGDLVTAGQLVAGVPEQTLGVPVHASIGGKVTRIGDGSLIIETGVGVH